jgi:hypothetical protein
MTSEDRCYCGARDTRVVTTSAHSNDGPYDISGPLPLPPTSPSDIRGSLLLPPIVVIGSMTSDDCCYCGTRGTCAVSTSPNNSDRPSDISEPLLLESIVAMGYMRSDDRYYYWAHVWYPVFMPKPSTHHMHDPGSIVPHIRPKVFTDNHMSWIKYNYYISNVSKDYDDSQQNRTIEDSITPQERQPGQHVT